MRKFVLRGFISILAMLLVFGPFNGGFLRPEKASAAVPFTEGTGKVDSPYLIGTAELFNELRNYTSSKYYFKLTNDIDLSGYSTGTGWDPIADGSRIFYAHLDGNGHKITGLTINKPTTKFVGLFGMVGTGFSITNLTLENVSVTGYESVGGLAGFVNLSGTIDNVSVSGQVTGTSTEGITSVHSGVGGLVGSINGATIKNSHSSANVSGDSYVGGLIGNMNMIILSNSSASGVVSGASSGVYTGGLVGDAFYGTITKCYATGNVFGGSYTGGLAGANAADISASYATGDVSGSTYVGGLFGDVYRGTISTSYATGDVIGSLDVGGLIGSMNTSAIGTSYATGDVNGDSHVGGLIGKSLNPSTLSNSYTSGAVSGTTSIGGLIGYKDNDLTILNSYASGLVNHGIGSSNVGGMLGESASYLGLDGTKKPILNSFYDMDSTGQSSSLGGTGVSTSQMKDRSTFEIDTAYAWDFTTIWAIHPQRNDGYPYLRTTQAYLDYSGNNGITSAIPPSRSFIPGEIVKVDSGSMNLNQNLIDAGYVFFGWNTASDGSGVTYRPGDSFTMTSDLTLYAYWMIPSSNATISSTIGTVSSGGTAEESVTNIPYGTTLAAFRAAIMPATQATFEIYEADGITVATQLLTGHKINVTAQDGVTKVAYNLTVNRNSAKDITSFSLAAQTGAATINATSHTVAIQVAYGTNNSSLAATFALSPEASAKVGNVDQISGTTVNDFTNPVTYAVTAGDGSTQNWIVTVTIAPNSAKDITSFSLAAQTGPATINASAHTVSITVAYGTSRNGLVASFTLSPGATAKVGTTTQVSGTTANNFTSAVTYTITAGNGTTQSWKVTVTVAAASSAKDITAFSFAEQTGPATINTSARTVAIEVANGTDVSKLVATFALSASASAKVGTVDQVSGISVNDFTNSVTYVVKAENSTTQNWTVNVSVAAAAASSAKSVTAFSFAEQTGPATIDTAAHTVTIEVANGTDVSNLVATFALSAEASAKVGNLDQVSGTTANDFTDAVVYTVKAEDGSTQDWMVIVNVAAAAASSANDITSFSFAEQTGPATIDTAAHSITIEVANGTDVSNLVATFSLSLAASAKVGTVDQVSGTTVNDFTHPFVYTVEAEDGSTQDWTVTVIVAKSNVATLTSRIGVVSSKGTVNETITNIPYGTSLIAFKSAITLASNATFDVYDSDGQTLAAVLATGKKVIVTAEDGITKVTYTITVNAAPGGNGSAPPITTPSDEGLSGHPSDNGSAENPSTKPQPTIVFSDINGHWSEEAIRQATQSGITAGYPDGTFKPNRTVTRAEFVVMLMNALKPKTAGAELNFADADKIGKWAREAVAQAVQEGIIKGYGDGSFRPNAEITRAEMVAMISNVLKLPIGSGATGFADDMDIPEWARGAIAAIKNLGIIQGTGNNRFNPNGNATRAEAATVLINMLARHNQ